MDASSVCAQCGNAALTDSDPFGGDREPCPKCGSLARHLRRNISDRAGATDAVTGVATIRLTAHAHAVLVESDAGDEVLETAQKRAPDRTVVNADHEVTLRGWELGDGKFAWALSDRDGTCYHMGFGDDWVDSLEDLVFAMLPPDHPGYLRDEPKEP